VLFEVQRPEFAHDAIVSHAPERLVTFDRCPDRLRADRVRVVGECPLSLDIRSRPGEQVNGRFELDHTTAHGRVVVGHGRNADDRHRRDDRTEEVSSHVQTRDRLQPSLDPARDLINGRHDYPRTFTRERSYGYSSFATFGISRTRIAPNSDQPATPKGASRILNVSAASMRQACFTSGGTAAQPK